MKRAKCETEIASDYFPFHITFFPSLILYTSHLAADRKQIIQLRQPGKQTNSPKCREKTWARAQISHVVIPTLTLAEMLCVLTFALTFQSAAAELFLIFHFWSSCPHVLLDPREDPTFATWQGHPSTFSEQKSATWQKVGPKILQSKRGVHVALSVLVTWTHFGAGSSWGLEQHLPWLSSDHWITGFCWILLLFSFW